MTFSRLAWLTGLLTALGSGGYALVSIYRWEWHRALVFGIVFLAVEIALATAYVVRALERGDDEPSEQHRDRPQRGQPHRFDWLNAAGGDRYGVFIPLLLGSGVIISALAKAVETVAGSTGSADPDSRQRPDGYDPIAFPAAELVPSDDEVRVQGLPPSDDAQLRRLLGPFAVAHGGGRRP